MIKRIKEVLNTIQEDSVDTELLFDVISKHHKDNSDLINSLAQNFPYYREAMHHLNNLVDSANAKLNIENKGNRTELYHGSPVNIDKFVLTKGKRSGFLGASKEVDNLGIFLTDSKTLAHYFGQNRGSYGNYKVYTVWVDLGRILDMNSISNIPLSARKIAIKLIEDYDGRVHKINNIPREYHWWLLDQPEFVDEIKKSFDSIKYREEYSILKDARDLKANTYFVLDPNRIEIPIINPIKLTASSLYSNLDYLRKVASDGNN